MNMTGLTNRNGISVGEETKQYCRVGVPVAASAQTQARTWLQLFGYMTSLVDALKLCRLWMRPVQITLRELYRPTIDPCKKESPIPLEVLPYLAWWSTRVNIGSGRPFRDPRSQTSIATDTSKRLGTRLGNHTVQGRWSKEESSLHINVLETMTVIRASSCWGSHLSRNGVTVSTDNTTTVAFNRQEGTRSRPLLEKTWELLMQYGELRIDLRASHLSGKENTMADASSRAAWTIDAFSFPWTALYLYAFPPWCLITRVLATLKESTSTMILMAAC